MSEQEPKDPESSPPPAEEVGDLGAEVREAFSHLKRAASLALERATKDPTVRSAGDAIRKVGEAAEPVAKQVIDDASNAFRKAGDEPVTQKAGTVAQDVAAEAEKTLKKAGELAEPVARDVVKELGRVGRHLAQLVGGSQPPPKPEHADEEE